MTDIILRINIYDIAEKMDRIFRKVFSFCTYIALKKVKMIDHG